MKREDNKLESEQIEYSLEILNNKLIELINKLFAEMDKKQIMQLENKINILQEIRDELYKGNLKLAKKVIMKREQGIL